MHPTRAQRDELKSLSLKLFGVESRWQKLQERTPVFSHYEHYLPQHPEYKKAKAAFARAAEPGEEFQAPKRPIYRKPTYDELLNSMRMMSDQMDYANASPEVVTQKAAADFLAKKLPVAVVLEVQEDKKSEFDGLRAQLPGDMQPWVDKMVNAELPQGAGVRLDGCAFVRNVLAVSLEAGPRPFAEVLAEKTAEGTPA